MDTVVFDVDKQAPSEDAIKATLSQAKQSMMEANKRYTRISFSLFACLSLVIFFYLYWVGGLQFWEVGAVKVCLIICVFFMIFSAGQRFDYYGGNDKKAAYDGVENTYLLMGFIRDVGRMVFLYSVLGLVHYFYSNFFLDVDSAPDDLEFHMMMFFYLTLFVLAIASSIVDYPFSNYRSVIQSCTAAPKEDCLLIQDYMVHPEINAYRHSVVEQGRVFVNGDVDAMAKRCNDINENKLIDEACRNVYEIGEVTK